MCNAWQLPAWEEERGQRGLGYDSACAYVRQLISEFFGFIIGEVGHEIVITQATFEKREKALLQCLLVLFGNHFHENNSSSGVEHCEILK